MNITDSSILLQKYDILELMVAQTTINEINSNIEPYVNEWVKNPKNVKAIRVHIWVNEMFYNILTTCKLEDKINKTSFYHDFFKYQLNFEQNAKMKKGEYEFYSIAIITEDKRKYK